MSAAPDFSREGADWPNRAASRFVEADGMRWHAQVAGAGPVALLLHGTGAATHSWRAVLPLLAQRMTVVAPDLPGHGFTSLPRDMSLPRMATAVAGLMQTLRLAPDLIVGHSAGAAVAARMTLDGLAAPAAIVAINGALTPFPGVASQLFPSLARALVLNPFVPALVAWSADRRRVKRLIENTGSRIDAAGLDAYAALLATRRHADAALRMMANWDLETLRRDLPTLRVPLLLLVGDHDRAVPPRDGERLAQAIRVARLRRMAGGHLAHEERPAATVEAILDFAADVIPDLHKQD